MTANMPTLYLNIRDGLPSEFAFDAFLWAAEQPGEDRMCYRAEAFAREADKLRGTCAVLIVFARRYFPSMSDECAADLLAYILARHANNGFGGNKRPGYLANGACPPAH